MDPNSSLGKICLGDDVIVISSDKVEGSRDWNSLEYQDTAVSKGNKFMDALSFYRMETDEISERYIAPCFVNGLEAIDGEVNLAFDENLISNESAVKLCLDYVVKKEEDFEPRVILGRSFLRLAQGVVDFGNGVITIYPDQIRLRMIQRKQERAQTIEINYLISIVMMCQNIGLSSSAGRHLTQEEAVKEELAIRISQRYALLEEERPVIETMAYNDNYKKILDEIWKDKVELNGKTVKEDEEAVKRIKGEALKEKDDLGAFIFPIRLERKVNENALADTGSDINTMPYRIFETLGREDMKKIDRGITMINHTQAKAMGKLSNVLCQVEVTTIITKFLIMDIPINRDAPIVVGRGFLHMMGSILNTSKRIFSTFDGVCHQTFRAERFDVLRIAESDSGDEEEYVIKRNRLWEQMMTRPDHHDPYAQDMKLWKRDIYSPCIVNWDVLNRMDYDGEIDDMLRIMVREDESEEEIFTSVAWIRAFNINDPIYAELCHEFYSTYEFDEVCADDELQTKKIIKFRLGGRAHSLTLLEFAQRLGFYQAVELEEDGFNVYFKGGLRNDDNFNAQDYWLSISREDNISLSRSHTSTFRNLILRVIYKMITYGLCQRTTGYANIAWVIARWMKRKGVGTQIESQICCGQFISKLARKCRVLIEDVMRSLSALIYCKDLDTTTLRDLIDSDGKLIHEDPQPGVPRVDFTRPPRASMQDLYDRIGRMEILQDAIERMEYRQSYH
ncbi:pescadillo-like protein [Tanacetum coccineum]